MNVRINKIFLKELAKVPKKEREKVENLIFNEVENYSDLYEIPNVGKLKGYSNYFRIRIGDYRIGIKFSDNTLVFERILHRKDIYKFYP